MNLQSDLVGRRFINQGREEARTIWKVAAVWLSNNNPLSSGFKEKTTLHMLMLSEESGEPLEIEMPNYNWCEVIDK